MAKLDKGRNLGKKLLAQKAVEQTVVRTAEVKNQMEPAEESGESPVAYAEGKLQERATDAAATTGNISVDALQYAYRRHSALKKAKADAAKEAAENTVKAGAKNAAEHIAEPNISTPEINQPTPAGRKDTIKRKTFETRARAAAAAGNAKQAAQAESKTMHGVVKISEDARKQNIQKFRKQQMIRGAVKKHFEQKAKAGVGGTITNAMPTAAPKLPAVSWKRALQERLSSTIKAALLKIQALLTGAVKAAASALLSLLGAGGIVLVLAILPGPCSICTLPMIFTTQTASWCLPLAIWLRPAPKPRLTATPTLM